MLEWIVQQGLAGEELTYAFRVLDRLYRVVHGPLSLLLRRRSQDLERVLNIFIRLNSGVPSFRTRTCY
jgi:hypothetical protein